MDWALLFSSGPLLCEESHTDNCFGLRTSANIVELVLLRPTDFSISIPVRSILLLLKVNGLQYFSHLVRSYEFILRRKYSFSRSSRSK